MRRLKCVVFDTHADLSVVCFACKLQPIYQALADEAIIREALGLLSFKITATNAPLPITSREEGFNEAADATTLWFLIVL